MPKYKGAVISDIHVGAFSVDRLHEELKVLFLDRLYKEPKLDFLVVAGDFFDHKFFLNDKEASVAYIILKEIVELCKEKNTVLRFVYGTESHECNQYDILSLLKIYDKVSVIKTVTEEELLPGLNILYLPEEQILDKDEYYKEYFCNKDKYDYVFGHGIVREVMKELCVHIDKVKENKTRKKPPVFNTSELSYICKGQVYFGHYHMNQEYNNKVFSISSFSRWRFGEEERKGYYMLECNTGKEKYNQTFIENTMADSFKSFSFGYDDEIFDDSIKLKESLDSIDNILKLEPSRHMKFIFNIPKNAENPESTISYIKEKLKYKDNIKIEIVNGYIDEKARIKKEKVDEESSKYSFIFDKSMILEDKISKFIEITYNKEINPKDISEYLYTPLIDILNREDR